MPRLSLCDLDGAYVSEGFKPMFSTGRAYLEVPIANSRLAVLAFFGK